MKGCFSTSYASVYPTARLSSESARSTNTVGSSSRAITASSHRVRGPVCPSPRANSAYIALRPSTSPTSASSPSRPREAHHRHPNLHRFHVVAGCASGNEKRGRKVPLCYVFMPQSYTNRRLLLVPFLARFTVASVFLSTLLPLPAVSRRRRTTDSLCFGSARHTFYIRKKGEFTGYRIRFFCCA